MRGLSSDISDLERAASLYPDYTKCVLDVYVDTVGYLLEHPQPGHNRKLGFLTIGYSITEEEAETLKNMNYSDDKKEKEEKGEEKKKGDI